MNAIWVFLVTSALVCGALNGRIDAVAKASIESAEASVTLALGLVGVMTFWLGMMKVLEEGGLLEILARLLRPVMKRLFPDVPPDHPAMSMMILNMAANMLGLNNAATPFGLKAMQALDGLNSERGTATNAMATFLAINTANIAIFPTSMVALRASLGSTAPASIFVPTLLATMFATCVAVVSVKFLEKLPIFQLKSSSKISSSAPLKVASEKIRIRKPEGRAHLVYGALLSATLVFAFIYALKQKALTESNGIALGVTGALKSALIDWPLPLLIGGCAVFSVFRRVKVYEAMVEGGKEGFQTAVKIIPFLVAILVAVGMLRAAGGIDLFVKALEPFTSLLGIPSEVLPMGLLRSLSGSGAYGMAAEIMKTHGADSLIGNIVSTIQGSTETTFYVLAVYFGAVQVRKTRHTLAACLVSDAAGILASVWVCRWWFK